MSAPNLTRRAHSPRQPLSRRTVTQGSVRAVLAAILAISGVVGVTRPDPAKSWASQPQALPPGAAMHLEYRALPAGAKVLQLQQQKAQAKAAAAAKAKARAEKLRTSRLAKRAWPASGRLTTKFNKKGRHWDTGRHTGVDFKVNRGSSVRAFKYGRVTFAGWDGAYGYKVVISHPNGLQTVYAHLSKVLVKRGQVVEAGKKIARSGSTGNTTGPHLHFEVIKNGVQVNPVPYLQGKRS